MGSGRSPEPDTTHIIHNQAQRVRAPMPTTRLQFRNLLGSKNTLENEKKSTPELPRGSIVPRSALTSTGSCITPRATWFQVSRPSWRRKLQHCSRCLERSSLWGSRQGFPPQRSWSCWSGAAWEGGAWVS